MNHNEIVKTAISSQQYILPQNQCNSDLLHPRMDNHTHTVYITVCKGSTTSIILIVHICEYLL